MKARARVACVVLLCLSSFPAANAATLPLICQAAGRLQYLGLNGEENVVVELHATGSCNGDLAGPYKVQIDGAGEAIAFGVCVPLTPILDVTLVLTNVRTGKTIVREQGWTLLTDLAVGTVTPIVINQPPGPISTLVNGAGVIVSRLFSPLSCLGFVEGSDTALFRWAFLR